MTDTEWLDPLTTYAAELLAATDEAILDADADAAAKDGATLLAPSFLRDGYFRLIRASLRAIARYLGRQWVADYLEALAAWWAEEMASEQVVADRADDQSAWDRLRVQLQPKRRRALSREEVEAAAGN